MTAHTPTDVPPLHAPSPKDVEFLGTMVERIAAASALQQQQQQQQQAPLSPPRQGLQQTVKASAVKHPKCKTMLIPLSRVEGLRKVESDQQHNITMLLCCAKGLVARGWPGAAAVTAFSEACQHDVPARGAGAQPPTGVGPSPGRGSRGVSPGVGPNGVRAVGRRGGSRESGSTSPPKLSHGGGQMPIVSSRLPPHYTPEQMRQELQQRSYSVHAQVRYMVFVVAAKCIPTCAPSHESHWEP